MFRIQKSVTASNIYQSVRVLSTSHVIQAFTKDMLLYSTEIDGVYDATIKKNILRINNQVELKQQANNERRKAVLEARDEDNFSVALPFIYPQAQKVFKAVDASECVEVLDPDLPVKEEETLPVYPYALCANPFEARASPRLEAGQVADDDDKPRGRGRGRGRSQRARKGANFDVLDDDTNPEKAKRLLAEDEFFKFGTADRLAKPSNVPCGGCGAHLHCNDPKVPGFTPAEVFKGKSKKDLRSALCQRCYIMKEYNVALKLSVAPDHYASCLQHVHMKRAIIVLVVDLLDFPGSIWPNILDILGPNKRIILVGNKVDLLPQDSPDYLSRVEKSMRTVFINKCNQGLITHKAEAIGSILVSARTGFNIERLIDIIFSSWKENRYYTGSDIFLVGTTNVGKSSIFNSLLESDLCKIQAIGQVEKAMTSPIPGTTMNLLKFPVMRPDPSRLNQRFKRLKNTEHLHLKEETKRIQLLRKHRDRKYSVVNAPIELTFGYKMDKLNPMTGGLFNLSPAIKNQNLPTRLDPLHHDFARGYWCYDTPGSVSEDQIINLLTQDEATKMLPDLPLIPRSFAIKNGHSLFIAGLARFDLIDSCYIRHPMTVTVFCNDGLPINIVRTLDADEFYQSTLGTDILKVPSGSPLRLKDFPALQGQEMEIDGVSLYQSSCDIVLSSAGWISCVPNVGQICLVKAWTPGGKGIYLRDPPFLPFAHKLRGKRIKGTCAYRNDRIFFPAIMDEEHP